MNIFTRINMRKLSIDCDNKISSKNPKKFVALNLCRLIVYFASARNICLPLMSRSTFTMYTHCKQNHDFHEPLKLSLFDRFHMRRKFLLIIMNNSFVKVFLATLLRQPFNKYVISMNPSTSVKQKKACFTNILDHIAICT